MSIAVVILNWNGKKLLETFLPSVVKYSKEAQIYVVDNASTDDSLSFLNTKYPNIKTISNTYNAGYAGGYNQGLKHIKEDIYILLNNDVLVSKNWLNPIIKTFKNQKDVAIVQPKILDYNKPEYFEYAGAAGGFLDLWAYPYCRGRIFDTLERDNGQYDEDVHIFWASGACLAIKRKVFWAIGAFDEKYFAHQEEIDLCWRAYNHGFKAWYTHLSCVYHLGGGTLNAFQPQKTFLNFRNSIFNIAKNMTSPWFVLIVLGRLILDALACVRFLFKGQFRHIGAVLRAHLSFYKHSPKIIKKRKKHFKNLKYYSIFSIVFEYFILGKKQYDKLI
ncbi:glycosyltransferase family 2 protein [Mesohalobacter halotolerans]|uniref:Glycosyltransferase family 2 protein n=1 Tax=Mesohalobacter halotolerans TaxID=1883405 RepID=A0A4U5TPH0_9FLAO|nr:glycosyltransferase family 2 protein [Mesohalobacter halotolerans]MBS3739311.1 glycosyltransferase family 2 protein [Psychroflexus sp.]TKS55866.1 glycosyltransferase family 2 protein [Mesohalobacter halotolerans]